MPMRRLDTNAEGARRAPRASASAADIGSPRATASTRTIIALVKISVTIVSTNPPPISPPINDGENPLVWITGAR